MPDVELPPLVRRFLADLRGVSRDAWLTIPAQAIALLPAVAVPGGVLAAIARRDDAYRALNQPELRRAIEDAVSAIADIHRRHLLLVEQAPRRTLAEAEVQLQWAATALPVRRLLQADAFGALYAPVAHLIPAPADVG